MSGDAVVGPGLLSVVGPWAQGFSSAFQGPLSGWWADAGTPLLLMPWAILSPHGFQVVLTAVGHLKDE